MSSFTPDTHIPSSISLQYVARQPSAIILSS